MFKSLKGLFMGAELIARFKDAFCADENKPYAQNCW
jgi:hypothetical protein